MPTNPDLDALCERLVAKHQVMPPQGGAKLTYGPNGKLSEASSYITDDGMRLVNPDGPEAAATIRSLREQVKRLQSPCPICNGTGRDDFRDHSHRCESCDGSGVEESR